MLTALSDSARETERDTLLPGLYSTLDRLKAEDSYSARLGYEYGSGLHQREAKRREPLAKQLAYQDAMKRLRPVPIGGWIGDAITNAKVGEPVHTARGSVVTVHSVRPLVVAVDGFLSDSAAAAAVHAHNAAFDGRIKSGETVCINDKTSASKLRSMTEQLSELARQDNAPSNWRPQQRPGTLSVSLSRALSLYLSVSLSACACVRVCARARSRACVCVTVCDCVYPEGWSVCRPLQVSAKSFAARPHRSTSRVGRTVSLTVLRMTWRRASV